jgi:hypothetical protein
MRVLPGDPIPARVLSYPMPLGYPIPPDGWGTFRFARFAVLALASIATRLDPRTRLVFERGSVTPLVAEGVVAEGVGFEPTETFVSRLFKSRAFVRSAIPPSARQGSRHPRCAGGVTGSRST